MNQKIDNLVVSEKQGKSYEVQAYVVQKCEQDGRGETASGMKTKRQTENMMEVYYTKMERGDCQWDEDQEVD